MRRLRLATAVPAAAAVIGVAALAMLVATTVLAHDKPAHANTAPGESLAANYYLSLGDSLAAGDQPNAQGVTRPTNQGYANQLYATLRAKEPGLRLDKLGCPGETTATLNRGGICGYRGDALYSLSADQGSQLAAALAFLRAHRGHVPLITIDIGANDLNSCLVPGKIATIDSCAAPAIKTAGENLATTLTALHAADPQATVVGMSYYIPELAYWLTGPTGREYAKGSVPLGEDLNAALAGAYAAAHVPVANVFGAFKTTDFTDPLTLPGIGSVPENVLLVCTWTWACAAPPAGPNEHANAAGYGVIAKAFLAALPARRR